MTFTCKFHQTLVHNQLTNLRPICYSCKVGRGCSSAEANATSLSWLVFNDLVSADSQQFGSAGATSVITIIGVLILLTPVLIRSWRDFNRKVV